MGLAHWISRIVFRANMVLVLGISEQCAALVCGQSASEDLSPACWNSRKDSDSLSPILTGGRLVVSEAYGIFQLGVSLY